MGVRWKSLPGEKLPTKYKNKKVFHRGHWFDSIRESERYDELLLLETSGHISGLQLQPSFTISIHLVKICKYIADFQYLERYQNGWKAVVEDVKGKRTSTFNLKARMFRACYPGLELRLIIAETKRSLRRAK